MGAYADPEGATGGGLVSLVQKYTRLRTIRFDDKTDDFLCRLKKPSKFVRTAVKYWTKQCLTFNEQELRKTEEEIRRTNVEVLATVKNAGHQSVSEVTLMELKTHPLLEGVESNLDWLKTLGKRRVELSEKVRFWRDAVDQVQSTEK